MEDRFLILSALLSCRSLDVIALLGILICLELSGGLDNVTETSFSDLFQRFDHRNTLLLPS